MNIVPVISIVGRSESGKTTLIEKLIPELASRGYRVGSIKHAQELDIVPGKDDSRHLRAGSEVTAVISDHETLIRKRSPANALEETVRIIGSDLDIVICEGFKKSASPKIEVHRAGNGPLLEGLNGLAGIVTDERLDTGIRQFPLDDVKALADFIEESYIKPQSDNLTLYVNGSRLPLIAFPRQIFLKAILGMVSSLKGVGVIKNLALYLRSGDTGERKTQSAEALEKSDLL